MKKGRRACICVSTLLVVLLILLSCIAGQLSAVRHELDDDDGYGVRESNAHNFCSDLCVGTCLNNDESNPQCSVLRCIDSCLASLNGMKQDSETGESSESED